MSRNDESSELNIRGMDSRLVEQVKIAALRRGGRAALRRWVSQALSRALREESTTPRPRLKLCAHCVRANEALAQRSTPPERLAGSVSPASSHADGGWPDQAAVSPFADLIEKIEEQSPELAPATDLPAVVPEPSVFGIQVTPGLWVGSDLDYERFRRAYIEHTDPPAWSVLQAAKEPWHREMVGYQTKSAPECAERLFARRGNRMALNLIDVRKLGPGGATYVPIEVVSAALNFIAERLAAGDQVLLHSSHGKSRAAGLAFLYMRKHGLLPYQVEAAVKLFREKYPEFEPGAGILATIEGLGSPAADVCANEPNVAVANEVVGTILEGRF